MNILVLMSGGFHPFHPGHLALYNSAKKAFPGADVVVGATNSQEKRPFNFKDKATLATIAGVDKGHFVEVNRQFSVKGEPNIENRIRNSDDTILIFVRSAKDANDPVLQPWKLNSDGSVPMTKGSKNIPPRPTSNYLLAYKGNEKQLEPMTKHAYIAFLPVQEFGPTDMTSATEIRNTWPALNDKRKQAFAMSLYPATQQNSKLLATVVNILNRNIGSVNIEEPDTSTIKQLKAKKLKEQIQRMRPLLKEASIEQKYKMLKLIKEATQLNELNLFKKKKLEPVEVEPNTSPNDYHAYFNKPEIKKQKVYRNPEEYVDATKKDPLTGKKVVDELNLFGKKPKAPVKPVEEPDDYRKFFNREPVSLYEPQDVKHYHNSRDYHEKTGVNPLLKKQPVQEFASGTGGNGGNYFQALASAWYNGTFNTGSLQKGIKSKQDVERLLQRGVLCPDNVTRKFNIDYNSDFDGVVIFSDDYYEHGDHDDTIDSRTGQKWGPYDFMEFSDDELDESLNEFATPGGDDNEPDEDEILFRLAKQWWLGSEQDMIRAERTLASMGWEIGEDEGSYDNGGVFVVRAGDVNGNSYISWPHEDLVLDEGPTSDMRNFFSTQQPLNPAPIQPTTTGPTVAIVTRQGESINELKDETIHSYLSKADRQISNRLDRMTQARERLNKSYEIYDANNPIKIIDKFEANTPELARRYFEKFIKEYNPGDQNFEFEVRRSTGLSEEAVAEDYLPEK